MNADKSTKREVEQVTDSLVRFDGDNLTVAELESRLEMAVAVVSFEPCAACRCHVQLNT
jgi:hypothetical protein